MPHFKDVFAGELDDLRIDRSDRIRRARLAVEQRHFVKDRTRFDDIVNELGAGRRGGHDLATACGDEHDFRALVALHEDDFSAGAVNATHAAGDLFEFVLWDLS